MISIKEQENLLLDIGRRLTREVTVYAIGGTAMMFRDLKSATLDIDLVFTDIKDREEFKKAALEIGYYEMNSGEVYNRKPNQPEMIKRINDRIDMFSTKIINFHFSPAMQKRAEIIHQFEKLIVRIADPHDIIIMKCATDRIKDMEDAKSIIEKMDIKWWVLIGEAQNQLKLGEKRALLDLGSFLEDLKNKMKIDVPEEILDELYKLVVRQVKERKELMEK